MRRGSCEDALCMKDINGHNLKKKKEKEREKRRKKKRTAAKTLFRRESHKNVVCIKKIKLKKTTNFWLKLSSFPNIGKVLGRIS